jgi:hypothetical protein
MSSLRELSLCEQECVSGGAIGDTEVIGSGDIVIFGGSFDSSFFNLSGFDSLLGSIGAVDFSLASLNLLSNTPEVEIVVTANPSTPNMFGLGFVTQYGSLSLALANGQISDQVLMTKEDLARTREMIANDKFSHPVRTASELADDFNQMLYDVGESFRGYLNDGSAGRQDYR